MFGLSGVGMCQRRNPWIKDALCPGLLSWHNLDLSFLPSLPITNIITQLIPLYFYLYLTLYSLTMLAFSAQLTKAMGAPGLIGFHSLHLTPARLTLSMCEVRFINYPQITSWIISYYILNINEDIG